MLPRPPTWRSETACPAASVRSPGSSRPCRLTAKRTRATRPLRSPRIASFHRYYETVRPCAPHRYSTLTVSAAWGAPSRRSFQHTTGRAGATGSHVPCRCLTRVRHLYAGHHLANQQAPARLIPGQQLDPGFDDVASLSTFHQWFTHVRLHGSRPTHLVRLFRNAHHHDS